MAALEGVVENCGAKCPRSQRDQRQVADYPEAEHENVVHVGETEPAAVRQQDLEYGPQTAKYENTGKGSRNFFFHAAVCSIALK